MRRISKWKCDMVFYGFGFSILWKPNKPSHGPQEWIGWKFLSFVWTGVGTGKFIPGVKRVWIYSKWGAIHVDFYNIAGEWRLK